MSIAATLVHLMGVSMGPIGWPVPQRVSPTVPPGGWCLARLAILVMCAVCIELLSGQSAVADTPSDAATLIQNANAAIRSYDVRLICTYRIFERKLAPVVRNILGAKISVPPFEYVPWDDAEVTEHTYRQVYRDQGKYPVPLRRVEEFTADGATRKSILAFDGTVRRSLYERKMKGLVAAPPDTSREFHQFVNYMFDYLTVVGMRAPSGYDPLVDLAIKLPSEKIELRDTDDAIILNLHPSEPESARRDGYRIWFDKQHGLMPREIQQYAVTADFNDVFVNEVEEEKVRWAEHNSLEVIVTEFTSIDDGGWAPLRVTIKALNDRGEYVGAIVAQTDITVDIEKSSWNATLDDELFSFDFPLGTRVTDDVHSVAFVVGDKDAGRNLDKLIASAKEMIPTREEGRALAGWNKPSPRGGGLSAPLVNALMAFNAIGLATLVAIVVWRRVRYARDRR